MSSLDSKPDLARAWPLLEGSTDTLNSSRARSCDADRWGTDESSQKPPSTMQDCEPGLPFQSVPSILNMCPRRPRAPLKRRDGGFSLSDTVVADTILRGTGSEDTDDSRRRMSGAASLYPANSAGEGSTKTRRGDSQSTQRTRSHPPLVPTSHAGHARRGRSDVSRQPVRTDVDPTEATPMVLADLITGDLSKDDLSRLMAKYLRAWIGGDA